MSLENCDRCGAPLQDYGPIGYECSSGECLRNQMRELFAYQRDQEKHTPKLFYLQRNDDSSGVSGTGRIAEGVQFSDGQCVLKWNVAGRSLGVYQSLEQLITVHGHEGRTVAIFL